VQLDRLDEAIAEGRSALARGEWAEARALFAESFGGGETPDAYEGLGIAARYELDAEAATEAHERGYRLARGRGDAAAAARLAIQLGYDAYAFRGYASRRCRRRPHDGERPSHRPMKCSRLGGVVHFEAAHVLAPGVRQETGWGAHGTSNCHYEHVEQNL
jgi:hypothetical protein